MDGILAFLKIIQLNFIILKSVSYYAHSLGLEKGNIFCPQEIPRSSPASPWKSPSFPPLLLILTQYVFKDIYILI